MGWKLQKYRCHAGLDPATSARHICHAGLRKSFGKTEIIRGVDLAVQVGERVGVIGPNGAGKSTLFNLISGSLRPSSGKARPNGKRIDGLKPF